MGIEAASAQMEEGAGKQHQEEEKKASYEEGNEEEEELNPEKQAKIERASAILESLMKKKADEPPDLAEKCVIF